MLKPDYQIDVKWLHEISYSLEGFKPVSTLGNTFLCRCFICGDSKKSKRIKRLYFYSKNRSLNYDCKNCGSHGSFWKFMEDHFPNQFEEYKKEQILNRFESGYKRVSTPPSSTTLPIPKNTVTSNDRSVLEGCVSMSVLAESHEAVKYLKSRGFKRDQINRLYFSDNFRITAEAINPEPLSENFPDEPRIVIPFFDESGNVEMIQGRTLDKDSKLRYITIKSSGDVDKIFGKESIDHSKTVYCVEGPLDSLFVDNCLATCDASLERSDADVLIWDNESRKKETVALIEHAIKNGRKVVIWPISIDSKMDINDMIQLGMTQQEIMDIIKENTFSGMKAKLQLNKWKKV